MPTLADLYSAIGTAKRKASDFVQNPMTSLAQMAGNANDRARALNEMTRAAAEEQDLYGPASKALGQKLAEAYNPVGMTVYHGSPHLFEKFALEKIGTGEGNQSYGRGLYMAESPGVAKSYKDALSKTLNVTENVDPLLQRIGQMALTFGDNTVSGALKWLSKYEEKGAGHTAPAMTPELVKQAKQNFESGVFTPGGALYKVDLPDTHIRRMLDWDEQLKNQPKQVRDLAKSLGMDMNDLGGDLLAKVGKGEEGKQILEKAGIRGIKYLDEKSRYSPYQVEILHKGKPYATSEYATKRQAEQYAKGKEAEGFTTKHRMVGTRNFVVFDPNHLTILERNNEKIK